jgi:tRNA A37 threonylcarbamoyladenosine biosynthesis protein TsaE
LASLGLAMPIKNMSFQLEFNSLAHLVQKLTSYEQCHPDIYQNKFKHQITLVDTEDAEDSGKEQEVAVVEWTRGGGKSRVLQVGKAERACKGFRLRRKQGRADL